MAATTGNLIGTEVNQTLISYGPEAAWGVKPSVQFQAIRYVGESLARSKQRNRPSEVNPNFEASAAVTTQDSAGGQINYALSYGTYDDFLASLLANDWQAAQAIAGVAGDITITNINATSATLSSTTANKFQNLQLGSWVRLGGFTNAANNGYFYISAKASNVSLTLTTLVASVTETPAGTAAAIRASTIQNGANFKSLWLQQKLASNQFLTYPGALVTAMTLSGGIGQFFNGSFTIAAQQEATATSDGSTGAVIAAPTWRVMDTIGGFGGVFLNEAAFGGKLDSFSLNLQRNGATPEFAMGSAAAQGMTAGTFTGSGQMRIFFSDFTAYTRFANETGGRLAFILKDNAGNAYVVTLLNCVFSSCEVVAGGPSQPVFANIGLELNPQTSGTGTVMIDRLLGA